MTTFSYTTAVDTLRKNGIKFCPYCKNVLMDKECIVDFLIFNRFEKLEVIFDYCRCEKVSM